MGTLKNILASLQDEISYEDEIEVYADSVKQALELASKEFRTDISKLDYEVIQKGTSGFFGIGRQPYRVLVRKVTTQESDDVTLLEKKLQGVPVEDLVLEKREKDADGSFVIRVLRSGIWLTVNPAKGRGREVSFNDVTSRLYAMQINNADIKKVEKEVRKPSGKPVKIGDWIPRPEWDGTMSIEITDDEMKAYIHFVAPRYAGRHMDFEDVVSALRANGVVVGIKEEEIKQYLEKMDYTKPLLAAEGDPPRHGKDAYIDYKVRIDKSTIKFEEDKETKRVDFKDLDLLENVVVGQILAVKVPPEEGIPGRTVTNRVLPARSGKDVQIRHGKGTILSEDGMVLTAEINGQVVYQNGKISVEPVLYIKGDVNLEQGNVIFLGSVIVGGNVQDGFKVKAAGNIEIKGVVQKADVVEAEGDIIIRGGIVGRGEARIESTGGSIYTKFIQDAYVVAEKDVIVAEGILHSFVDAGGKVLCNGKRAKIVGGRIRAGEEVNARFIGADASTKTEIRVGINPKVHQQMVEMDQLKRQIDEELEKIKKDVTTLTIQKNNAGGKLPPDREELLVKLKAQQQKLVTRQTEIAMELDELKAYLSLLEQKGKICAEKTLFPGVEIYIKDKKYDVKDPYNYIRITLEGDNWKFGEYEPPTLLDEQARIMPGRRSISRRR
ncbi:MAG: FapA family protein [Spirochaetes bacterium]|nr:FapA family protein [Spirochaetota bacterium]